MSGEGCSIPRCNEKVAPITLYAVDGMSFKFCWTCGPEYQKRGYTPEPPVRGNPRIKKLA